MRVQPLPGPGLVVRAGELLAVCADRGDETADLVAVLHRAAADGGDGDGLITRLAGRVGAEGPACAVLALGGRPAILVRGAADVRADGGRGRVELRGPALAHQPLDGTLWTVRLSLPGSGSADPRTALHAGVVSGAGLLAQLGRPVPPPRRPDRAAPFEAVIVLPGYAPEAAPAADQTPTRALIEGVYCRDEHFNDPGQRYCQICGISMAQLTQVTRLGPRPPLGLLLLDDGSTLRLDTDYVVGREPDIDSDVAAHRARPLRVSGPASGVSRRHVRVRLTGWRVELVDLGSANGTFVHRPGAAEPERLVPGVPVVVSPGARVDVGRRWFRYESHRNSQP
ncbi:FHA domain-containing protein [Jidongwangia harbinensis]|uniref:FHA domain-containing protein n=1 Tax=Jidongwangia harbinensis TaxID=2878561 RepID=UPI001CDA34EE|nr:FHA domain-containing protein [Jidongwangia harbinensis]MCA2216429.1 FHA domain-containing protein [Jidongwangia harbinensis]